MKNIFDWLKEINFLKSPVSKFSDKDWDLWNSYMIHREFIPTNNKWNKYIKSNIKQHNNELLSFLSSHWECSKNEVKEYLNILDDDKIINTLASMGLEQKEINKLLK